MTPRFSRRWTVVGYLPGDGPATTLFDLAVDRRSLTVHPAAISRFSLIFAPASVQLLHQLVHEDGTGDVPGFHAVQGKQRMSARPYDGPAHRPWVDGSAATELAVRLPGDRSFTQIFAREFRVQLLSTMDEVLAAITCR